jgi:predicted nucleic acid-binding Zn ribbon protein
VERIPNHGHCWICGRAVPFGEHLCSPECEAKHAENQRKRRLWMWLLYGAMALAIGVIVYNAIGR